MKHKNLVVSIAIILSGMALALTWLRIAKGLAQGGRGGDGFDAGGGVWSRASTTRGLAAGSGACAPDLLIIHLPLLLKSNRWYAAGALPAGAYGS